MARFAQGKYALKNPDKYIGGRTPTYRSSWEYAFMRMCDTNDSISKWASEAVKIPYRNPLSGKYTIYVPDFFIVYVDRTGKQKVELIEVKPANQTTLERAGRSRTNQLHYAVNQAKWAAARAYCKQKGMFFRVVNEGDIFHQGKRR
jgi:hypothetical protein|tara:strand:- start:1869 stop:2306 length:438 start_codon:yes stop_codon:yes gene_type:complete